MEVDEGHGIAASPPRAAEGGDKPEGCTALQAYLSSVGDALTPPDDHDSANAYDEDEVQHEQLINAVEKAAIAHRVMSEEEKKKAKKAQKEAKRIANMTPKEKRQHEKLERLRKKLKAQVIKQENVMKRGYRPNGDTARNAACMRRAIPALRAIQQQAVTAKLPDVAEMAEKSAEKNAEAADAKQRELSPNASARKFCDGALPASSQSPLSATYPLGGVQATTELLGSP